MPPHRNALSFTRAPLSSYPYVMPPSGDMVEVVDAKDRPLMLMPTPQALEQGLPYRGVRVLLCDMHARALLIRPVQLDGTAGLWTLPTARVRAGEPREAAALRALQHSVGITEVSLRAAEKKDSSRNPRNTFFLAQWPAEAPALRAVNVSEFLFLDSDELHELSEHFPTLLDAELLHNLTSNYMASLLVECNSVHNS